MQALDVSRPASSLSRAATLVGLVVAAAALVGVLVVTVGGGEPSSGPPRGNAGAVAPSAVESATARGLRVPAGARFVSPSGSDAGPGTRRQPWRTLDRALESAGAGDTVVLRPGSYGVRGSEVNFDRGGEAGAPLTIMGTPGQRLPAILGAARIDADHLRLSGLLFDGPTGPVLDRDSRNPKGEQVVVAIMGDDVTISDGVVREGLWHAGIYVEGGDDIRIVRNHIHDNGDRSDPRQENLDHGIYWARGSGLIADNVIERNLSRGIQLYPYAEGVVVTHNTVVGNGKAGVQLGDRAADNVIVNNIVAYNAGSGIRSSDLGTGGNRVLNNLVWANREGNIGDEIDGLEVSGTIEADPRLERGRRLCPTAGSPAVDRALAAYASRSDQWGIVRGRNRPDLGACELVAREPRSP